MNCENFLCNKLRSYQACDIFKLTQIASFIVSNLLLKRTHIILMPLIADHIMLLFYKIYKRYQEEEEFMMLSL